MYRYEVHHLDGSPWLSNVGDFMSQWPWVTERMTELFGCDYADVEIMETEAHGDILIVRGQAVGLLPAPRRP